MYGTLISAVTVGAGGATSIDFTSIPQTYTDLILIVSARNGGAGTTATDSLQLRLNGSTTGYTYRSLFQIGTTTYSATNATNAIYSNGGDSTSNTFGNTNIYLPNYALSTSKTWSVDSVAEQNVGTGVWLNISANAWSTSAAVTSLFLVSLNSYNFQQYSTAYLYGLTKGSGGATVS